MGRGSVFTGFGGETDGKSHLEDPGVDGKIILRWNFRKLGVKAWTDHCGSG
jgi:hypothetical protein